MGAISPTYLNDIKFATFTSEFEMDYHEMLDFFLTKMKLLNDQNERIRALFHEYVGGEHIYYVGISDTKMMNELNRICRMDGNLKFLRYKDQKVYVTTSPDCTAVLKKVESNKEGTALKILHKRDFNLTKMLKLLIDDYGGNLNMKILGFLRFNDRTFIQSQDAFTTKTLLNIFTNRKIKCMIVYDTTVIDFKPYGDKNYNGELNIRTKNNGESSVKDRLGPSVPITIETYRKRRAEQSNSDESETPNVFLKEPPKKHLKKNEEKPNTTYNVESSADISGIPLAASTMIGTNEITSVRMCQIGTLDISKLGSGKWKIMAIKEDDN